MRETMEESLLFQMGFDPAVLIVVMLVSQLILFVLVIKANMRYNRLKRSYNSFMKGKDGRTMEQSILERLEEIDALAKMAKLNRQNIKEIFRRLDGNYQKIGIVRYDSFEETGGNLSAALTLLDGNNNGFILNTIHNGEGCYNYVKEIVRGESYMELSAEEAESLEKAMYQEEYALKGVAEVKDEK